MAQANSNTRVNVGSLLQKTLGNGFGYMQSFIREYPGFAYLGLTPMDWYEGARNINGKSGSSIQKLNNVNDTQFAKIGKIESDLTEDGKKVTWYEGNAFATKQKITADATAAADIVVEDVSTFAVNDRVRTMPAKGSSSVATSAVVTAINTGTNTITLSTSVTVAENDYLLFVNHKHVVGQKITRKVSDPDAQLITSYFGKFGASVTLEQADLNKDRLLFDAKTWIANKFNQPKSLTLENIISTWFMGNNVGGNEPEAQGIEHVIAEREGYGIESIHDLSGATDDKELLKQLQDVLNLAATAPVYMGGEKPTVMCTTSFRSRVSRLLQGDLVRNDFIPKEISYNLETLSTPFFSSIQFIVSTEMDRLYQQNEVAFVFPKELIGFRTPKHEYVDSKGVTMTTSTNRFSVIQQPVTTNDFREYTTEFYLANIFGGQSYENAYKKITL
ncbi:MAG: hypothetical protein ACPHY8_01640 [Patescibacteria group bacterium]